MEYGQFQKTEELVENRGENLVKSFNIHPNKTNTYDFLLTRLSTLSLHFHFSTYVLWTEQIKEKTIPLNFDIMTTLNDRIY